MASRFLGKWHPLPHPREGLSNYLSALEELVQRQSFSVVLALNDYTALALSQARLQTRLVVPPASSVDLAHDKFRTLELARSLGLAIPRSRLVRSQEELRQAVEELGTPLVIKLNRGNGAIGMRHLRTPATGLPELSSATSDEVYDFGHFLVQTELQGKVHDVCVLFEHGQLRAALTQKRLRTYPPEGGVGILVETTWRPDLVELAELLLKALNWHGPAQVEFLLEGPQQTPTLLEINGRFWGKLDLAIQAGVNFPQLACCPQRSAPSSYRVGLRYRWSWPLGLLYVLQIGRGGWDFFFPNRATVSDFWWSDPLPLVAEAWCSLQSLSRRGFRPISRLARVRGKA